MEADSAMVMNRGTFITTLSHPARVMVLGTKDSKYQVRLADGKTGEIDMNEIPPSASHPGGEIIAICRLPDTARNGEKFRGGEGGWNVESAKTALPTFLLHGS